MKVKSKEALSGYFFLTPNLIGFLVFLIFPVVASLLLSFSNWNLINSPTFAGLNNYQEVFRDSVFLRALMNTAYFSFGSVCANIILALFFASLLNQKIRGSKFFQAAFFVPVVYSTVAVALIWQWLFDYQLGYLNHVMSGFKLGPYPWIMSHQWAMPSIILVSVWKGIGFNMVIFMAALKGVPEELYESAKIDGAGVWRTFLNITLPMISPATFFVIVTSIINSFQVFDVTTVLTGGGPGNATLTLVMLIYQQAFQFFRMGYASAIAYTLFGIVLIFTIIQTIVSKRWVHY